MRSIRPLFTALALLGFAPAGQAQKACNTLDSASGGKLEMSHIADPCPAADKRKAEIHLPMPHAPLSLAFRRIGVENENFWCSQRKVSLGVADLESSDSRDPFRAEVESVDVFGSVGYDARQEILLGKYELTFGQAASIAALDRDGRNPAVFAEGVQRLKDRMAGTRNPKLTEFLQQLTRMERDISDFAAGRLSGTANQKLFVMLATPLRGLSVADYDDLLIRYNLWCYRNGPCAKAMSRAAGSPQAFVRLPTEIEWEYAARWGNGVRTSGEMVPTDAGKLAEFAVVSDATTGSWQVKHVGDGRRATGGGLYDMLGNVQELVLDPFRTLMVKGRVGARTVRGGSYLSTSKTLDFTARAEINLYSFDKDGKFNGANRAPYTGLRLTIGAPVKLSARFVDEKKSSFGTECTTEVVAGAKKEAGCDGDAASDPLCVELGALDERLTARNAELCETSTLAAISFGRQLLNSAFEMASAKSLLNEGLKESARRRQVTRYRRNEANLESGLQSYIPLIKAIGGFGTECAPRAIRKYLALNKEAASTFQHTYTALSNLVSADIAEFATYRRPSRKIKAAYIREATRLSVNKLK